MKKNDSQSNADPQNNTSGLIKSSTPEKSINQARQCSGTAIVMPKKKAEQRKTKTVFAVKYLLTAALFVTVITVISVICAVASCAPRQNIVSEVYLNYKNAKNETLYQNSGVNQIIDSLSEDEMLYGNFNYDNWLGDKLFDSDDKGVESDYTLEMIFKTAQIERALSAKIPDDLSESTSAPADLYVPRVDTDAALTATPGTGTSITEFKPWNDGDAAGSEITGESEDSNELPLPAEAEMPVPEYNVVLQYSQKDNMYITTTKTTVGELLEKNGITLTENDKKYIDIAQVIDDHCKIQMETIEISTKAVEQSIPYKTTYVDSQTVPRGSEAVSTKGSNGVYVKEYVNKYVNGVLVSETFSKEYTKQSAVNAVIEKGIGGTITGADGVEYSFSYYVDVKATTYTGGEITATGLPADENVIAVDPKVIPLRSKVYVKGDYGDFGVRIAADVGGGIKNNIIDVYLEKDNPYFANFGWRNMRVYILED